MLLLIRTMYILSYTLILAQLSDYDGHGGITRCKFLARILSNYVFMQQKVRSMHLILFLTLI